MLLEAVTVMVAVDLSVDAENVMVCPFRVDVRPSAKPVDPGLGACFVTAVRQMMRITLNRGGCGKSKVAY